MSSVLTFSGRQAFREWLGKHGAKSDGIWVLFRKKRGSVTLSAADALEEALCHGWIDGQIQSLDDNTYRKYFARRTPTSRWSVKNKQLAQTLMEMGLMTQEGLDAIARARECGSWDNPSRVIIGDEQVELFRVLIKPHEPAYTNLLAMSKSVQRTYTGFYFDAKTDKGRWGRLDKIIDRLNKNLNPM
jgi:uncharacterized protein YdeI (YjbR/CyaY-like superfamily)